MMASTFFNGERTGLCQVNDRGLQFGDGLFETLLCLDGCPIEFSEHWGRLRRGCYSLGIACPNIKDEVENLLRQEATLDRMVAKIILTRGYSSRGYRCPAQGEANWIVMLSAAPEVANSVYRSGVAVTICRTRIAIEDPKLVGLKHLNRLTQVLARREWTDEFHEGLVTNRADHVIEATASNLFFVFNKRLVTPDLSQCGVHGIVRDKVMQDARRAKIPLQVRQVLLPEIFDAQEIFLTNSVYGIVPVRSVGNAQFSVGPLTKEFQHKRAEGLVADVGVEHF